MRDDISVFRLWTHPLESLDDTYQFSSSRVLTCMPTAEDTHDLHRFVDDLFTQPEKKLGTSSSGSAAYKLRQTDCGNNFNQAPRGAALGILQRFGVPPVTPFSVYLCSLWMVIAGTIEKGAPLAPSPEMMILLVKVRLFPGNLSTKGIPYDSLVTISTAFTNLERITSHFTDCGTFTPMLQISSSHPLPTTAPPVATVIPLERNLVAQGDKMLRIVSQMSHPCIPAVTRFRSPTGSSSSMTVTSRLCVPSRST